MKRKGVEVDAKPNRKERGLGDAPVLGRVAKVASSDNLAEPTYEEIEEYDEEPVSGEWLIRLGMISALLIGLIVGGAVIYYTAASKLKSGQMVTSDHPRAEKPSTEDEGVSKLISEDEALDLVRRGLAVRFSSKVTDYFRYTPTLDALVVVEFLKGLSENDGLVVRMEWLEPVVRDGITLGRVRVHFNAGQGSSSRDAYLLKTADGEWRIDYESFAKGGEPVLMLPQPEEAEESEELERP